MKLFLFNQFQNKHFDISTGPVRRTFLCFTPEKKLQNNY